MMRTMVLAGLAVVAMGFPARAGSIPAGGVAGTWAPIAGYGEIGVYETQQTTDFSVADGTLTLDYEPADPDAWAPAPTGYIELDLGSAGYDIVADQEIQETVDGDTVSFSALYGLGGSIGAMFSIDPSAPGGLRLDGVWVSPVYHRIDGGLEITFSGQDPPPPAPSPVPEPSSGLLLGLGLGGPLGWRRRARPA